MGELMYSTGALLGSAPSLSIDQRGPKRRWYVDVTCVSRFGNRTETGLINSQTLANVERDATTPGAVEEKDVK